MKLLDYFLSSSNFVVHYRTAGINFGSTYGYGNPPFLHFLPSWNTLDLIGICFEFSLFFLIHHFVSYLGVFSVFFWLVCRKVCHSCLLLQKKTLLCCHLIFNFIHFYPNIIVSMYCIVLYLFVKILKCIINSFISTSLLFTCGLTVVNVIFTTSITKFQEVWLFFSLHLYLILRIFTFSPWCFFSDSLFKSAFTLDMLIQFL